MCSSPSSVFRLTGISDFRRELGLTNDLLDVLAAWPGAESGVFIIDALDATRGGPSEAVIAAIIELAVARHGERWSIVASIRTFDLLNGRRFREVMRGVPPILGFAEADLTQVRHFRIPHLSVEELAGLASAAPLAEPVGTAPLNLSPCGRRRRGIDRSFRCNRPRIQAMGVDQSGVVGT